MSKINYRQLNVILKVISLSSKIFRIIKLYKYINIKLHKCTKEFRKTHSQKKKQKTILVRIQYEKQQSEVSGMDPGNFQDKKMKMKGKRIEWNKKQLESFERNALGKSLMSD